jgi:hypothetical protein
MDTFPLTPDFEISKDYVDPAIGVTFENGVEQIRPRWSRAKLTFRISFSGMSKAEKLTLESFYILHRCIPFIFRYEDFNYIVRFNKPIQIRQTAPDLFNASVELIEFWGIPL